MCFEKGLCDIITEEEIESEIVIKKKSSHELMELMGNFLSTFEND